METKTNRHKKPGVLLIGGAVKPNTLINRIHVRAKRVVEKAVAPIKEIRQREQVTFDGRRPQTRIIEHTDEITGKVTRRLERLLMPGRRFTRLDGSQYIVMSDFSYRRIGKPMNKERRKRIAAKLRAHGVTIGDFVSAIAQKEELRRQAERTGTVDALPKAA